jgi:hypothetical protein
MHKPSPTTSKYPEKSALTDLGKLGKLNQVRLEVPDIIMLPFKIFKNANYIKLG